MIHRWSEATEKLDHYVSVPLLAYSKAFDLINHNTLLVKLKQYDLPPHIRRWIATFLLDRTQQVKIGRTFHRHGTLKEECHRRPLLGPKCFLGYINDLETPAPLYKYVDDGSLFEICHRKSESVLQHSVDIAARWTLHNDKENQLGQIKRNAYHFYARPRFQK